MRSMLLCHSETCQGFSAQAGIDPAASCWYCGAGLRDTEGANLVGSVASRVCDWIGHAPEGLAAVTGTVSECSRCGAELELQ